MANTGLPLFTKSRVKVTKRCPHADNPVNGRPVAAGHQTRWRHFIDGFIDGHAGFSFFAFTVLPACFSMVITSCPALRTRLRVK